MRLQRSTTRAINDIYAVSRDYDRTTREINLQAIALFVAITGCWSVPAGAMRFVALGCATLFFVYSVTVSIGNAREQDADLHQLNREELKNDPVAWALVEVLDSKMSAWGFITRGWPYFVTLVFLGMSGVLNLPRFAS